MIFYAAIVEKNSIIFNLSFLKITIINVTGQLNVNAL